MQIALFLAYPASVHAGVLLGLPQFKVMAIVFLAAAVFYRGLIKINSRAWLGFTGVSIAAVVIGILADPMYLLFVPPVAVPLLISWGFIRTLLPGQVPLVTDIGERARGPLSDAMKRYTRGVTLMWAVSLVIMGCWAILIPIFGTIDLWSIFTNIVNQVLVASLFFGEFVYRKMKFQDHDHPSFIEYIKIVFGAHKNKTS